MQMTLSVQLGFSAAHQLPLYDGPCRQLHGHNYVLRVKIAGPPSATDGMVRDFEEVRRITWDKCLAVIDHTYLNDKIPNPTAENIAVWIWAMLEPVLPGLEEIELWETPEYSVTYRR